MIELIGLQLALQGKVGVRKLLEDCWLMLESVQEILPDVAIFFALVPVEVDLAHVLRLLAE